MIEIFMLFFETNWWRFGFVKNVYVVYVGIINVNQSLTSHGQIDAMISGWWILKIDTTPVNLKKKKRNISTKFPRWMSGMMWKLSFKLVIFTPSSSKCTLSTLSPAGLDTVRKYARDPKEFESDHNRALAIDRPRTSKL